MCLGICCLGLRPGVFEFCHLVPSIVAVPDDSGTSAAKIGRPETSLDPDGVFPDFAAPAQFQGDLDWGNHRKDGPSTGPNHRPRIRRLKN